MRAWFMGRHAREKLLLLVFLGNVRGRCGLTHDVLRQDLRHLHRQRIDVRAGSGQLSRLQHGADVDFVLFQASILVLVLIFFLEFLVFPEYPEVQ